MACSSPSLEPPIQAAANLYRPTFNALNAMVAPFPILKRRFSAGTIALVNFKGVVDDPFIPIFFSSAPTSNPSVSRSIINPENLSPSTCARTVKTFAQLPLLINCLSPFKI